MTYRFRGPCQIQTLHETIAELHDIAQHYKKHRTYNTRNTVVLPKVQQFTFNVG
jgi:hypothetical protein